MHEKRKLLHDTLLDFLESVVIVLKHFLGIGQGGSRRRIYTPGKSHKSLEIAVKHGIIGRRRIISAKLFYFTAEKCEHFFGHMACLCLGKKLVGLVSLVAIQSFAYSLHLLLEKRVFLIFLHIAARALHYIFGHLHMVGKSIHLHKKPHGTVENLRFGKQLVFSLGIEWQIGAQEIYECGIVVNLPYRRREVCRIVYGERLESDRLDLLADESEFFRFIVVIGDRLDTRSQPCSGIRAAPHDTELATRTYKRRMRAVGTLEHTEHIGIGAIFEQPGSDCRSFFLRIYLTYNADRHTFFLSIAGKSKRTVASEFE